MSNRHQPTSNASHDNSFRLNPLAACVRSAITGGVLMGAMTSSYAELPVAAQAWVSSGGATSQVLGNTLRIDQQTDKAILNWDSFNVGKENVVQFVQPNATSVALNRINQQDPSRIFGQIVANGQIYLYNKNGFVFGKDSVVNANSLLASTLNITDEVFSRGITRVFDEDGRAALAVDGSFDSKNSKILIEAGAKIHVDKTGRIILAAPTIQNNGSLSADDQGQIIMAASQDKVYLQAADSESPFAGLVVEVETGGKVTNAGDILARQGNVTLAGFAVNQEGRISATTSVNVNGSIRLLAQEKHGSVGGNLVGTETTRTTDLNDGLGTKAKLNFANGSLTQVVPDGSGGAAIDEQKQPQSYIEAVAHDVSLQSGSAIVAPAGKVNITATNNPQNPLQGSSGRIFMDKGALIDVSGSANVAVPIERNVAEISVQSFELRNSPLQKTGPLKGETVKIDLRKGSKIVDTSGAEARISRGIEERLGAGGEINLTSSGDVVINSGAQIDISGGSVDYQAGYISTTKLIDEYGRIVDISDADPDQRYVSVFGVVNEDHPKWGVYKVWNLLEQFTSAQFEAGYSQGMAAGRLNINAPYLAWNGQLIAGSGNGIYQRQPGERVDGGRFLFDSTAFVTALQRVRFQTDKNALDIGQDEAFPEDQNMQKQDLVFSSDLTNSSGVQHVTVKTYSPVEVTADANIQMVAGGEFNVEAGSVDVQGKISSPGGDITLAIAKNLVGEINLGAGAELNVSGQWINDFVLGYEVTPSSALLINGGTIKIGAVGDKTDLGSNDKIGFVDKLFFRKDSHIKADGGGWLDRQGELSPGNGGSISLIAENDGDPSVLYLDGNLSAVSLSKGGKLTLSSDEIVIGNGLGISDDALRLGVTNGLFNFDQEAGFGEINLIGNLYGVTVTAGTLLDLKTANLLLNSDFKNHVNGGSLRDFAKVTVLEEYLRSGNSLNLSAGLGNVVLANGSSVTVDKQGSVSLASSLGGVFVDGNINAPAGNISLAIEAQANAQYDASQTVRLGQHARLLAQGTTRLNQLDNLGRQTGEVLDGGQVSFDLQRGSLVFEQGSLIDVSGSYTVLDLPKQGGSAEVTLPTQVFGNAGQVDITVAEAAIFDGKIIGLVSSETARGGRFSFALDRTRRAPPEEPVLPFPNNTLVVRVRNEQEPIFDSHVEFGDNMPTLYEGQAFLSASMLQDGGFTDIRLKSPDTIRFEGHVNLSATARIDLDTAVIDWAALNGEATGAINLNSALIRMGSSLQREVSVLPATGAATFNAQAKWIELFGATRWDKFKAITLDSAYDLRTVGLRFGTQREFLGAMVTAADLNLKAGQIYPSTLSEFTFAVRHNPLGQIKISSSGNNSATPLSAAGMLNFEAPWIEQAGVVKAPLGVINFNAASNLTLKNGSLTSVSGQGRIIPFGVTQAGLDWLYPLDSIRNLVFSTPPEKKLVLNAPELILEKGSTVDLSGGGDLFAYEFLPGSGGSYDYLDSGRKPTDEGSYVGGFAILPSLNSDLAPFDHYENNIVGGSYEFGKKVYLSANNEKGLAAGEYTMLPAHYALLPGAFLVTPKAGTQDQTITTFNTQGVPIVTGYYADAGTGTRDSRWSGFQIENGADIRLRSEYEQHFANDYYPAQAAKNETAVPLMPMDSGQISLVAQNKLVLESTFLVDALAGGRGARMDIAADKIHVVNGLSQAPQTGVLEILAGDLNNLKVDSLLLGGDRIRSTSTGETDITVRAKDVIFTSGSTVNVKDMMVAATDKVELQSGVALSAQGPVNTGDSVINIDGDGALLRLSGDKQVTLNRTNAPGVKGRLNIAAGSTLAASESMLLDASKSTLLQGDILMHQGSLNLSANSINLGEVDNLGGNALNLSNRKLLNLTVDELLLTARDSLGIYGNLGVVNNNGAPIIGADGLQEAIGFKRLVIDSAGLTGHGQFGNQARIQADTLRLQNSRGTSNQQVVDGQGRLDLISDNVEIGSGTLALQGFNAVDILAKNQLRAEGGAILNVKADLNVFTPALTASGGADLTIDATGYSARFNNLPTVGDFTSGFGGALALTAESIVFNTQALLPSGRLNLHALSGDISLGAQAYLDLAGRGVQFADVYQITPGGHFSAVADHGSVKLLAGSLVDLDAGLVVRADNHQDIGSGGELTLQAAEQSVVLAGQIQARNGSASIDVDHFNGGGFDALMQTLHDAGVNQSLYFRSRSADIVQTASSVIQAHNLTLVADKGSMSLAGILNANGSSEGGTIDLYAGDLITLENTASLTARGAQGGKVLLSSTDNDGDNISGVSLASGSLIDVAGDSLLQGGEVTLRALRNGSSLNLERFAGSRIQGYAQKAAVYDVNSVLTEYGYSQFFAEGVQKYINANGFLTSNDFNGIQIDSDAYMTAGNMQAVTTALGGARLLAGVEVSYDGNLSLSEQWDLASWRYSEGGDLVPMPGNLVIRASGDLTLNATLSDGFDAGVIPTVEYGDIPFLPEMLQSGESWSYSLTAGADLFSADLSATATAGNLIVGSGVTVRTGTGDMQLIAGGDIRLTDYTSTVYNAGHRTATNPYGSMALPIVTSAFGYVEYPVAGGDLTMKAGGNVKGAVNNNSSSKFINDWMIRQGNGVYGDNENGYLHYVAADLVALKDDPIALDAYKNALPASYQALIYDDYKIDVNVYTEPTTWGVVLNDGLFKQNIGSFGGGKVSINAAGDVIDLSVMMPTTGKQVGSYVVDPNVGFVDFLGNQLEVNGGGEMLIKAGGDVAGGLYYLGQGVGRIEAGGVIKGGSQFANGPQLLIGDTDMTLFANRDLAVGAVSDPMIMHAANTVNGFSQSGNTNFFSYGDNSRITTESLSGDVFLGADLTAIKSFIDLNDDLAPVYPVSLNTTAFSGSVVLTDDLLLFPSARANLNVFAKQDFKSKAAAKRLMMSDADLSLLPSALTPIAISDMASLKNTVDINPFGFAKNAHAAAPVHHGDTTSARLVTLQGDIDNVQINLAKKAIIKTGNDFKNVLFWGQHANTDDTSVFSIGRDLRFTSSRDENGQLNPNINEIKMAGPGEVLVKTGRNLDLGAAVGLYTTGNLINTALNDSGANLSVIVGLNGKQPAYAAFIEKYLFDNPQYQEKAAEFKSTFTQLTRQLLNNSSLSEDEAWSAFKSLLSQGKLLGMEPVLSTWVTPIYMNEIRLSGRAAAIAPESEKKLAYQRGFDAIESLFPGSDWKGDLTMYFSKIHTLDDGNINLMVPGGGVNVGLAVGTDAKQPSDLGIVAQRSGEINAIVRDDFLVNQSRVFALAGGDIMLWSSAGDLNAGAGAKSSIAAPPPKITYDENGNLVIVFPPIVSGSGIRTAADAGKTPGDVDLFAPVGVVDAGEAGIGGTNVTISATAVLGANNIQVGGISTGVPVASTGSLAAGLTGAGNMTAGVSQVAESSIKNAAEKDSNSLANAALGMLSVEVVGFGE